jgi:hypothetical protein
MIRSSYAAARAAGADDPDARRWLDRSLDDVEGGQNVARHRPAEHGREARALVTLGCGAALDTVGHVLVVQRGGVATPCVDAVVEVLALQLAIGLPTDGPRQDDSLDLLHARGDNGEGRQPLVA